MKLSPFAFEVFQQLKTAGLTLSSQKFVLAVSGGTDSVALMPLFSEFEKNFNCQVRVATVHHGKSSSGEQNNYRAEAVKKVSMLCEKYGWGHEVNSPPEESVHSEEDLRNERLFWLKKWRDEAQSNYIVLAHHQEDLLETRLMRLIRGTGGEGLGAMTTVSNLYLRPFLGVSKEKIVMYSRQNQVEGLADPSNKDLSFFRNWVRHEWLPKLEEFRPGAARSLDRSLQTISDELIHLKSDEMTNHFFQQAKAEEVVGLLQLAKNEALLGQCSNWYLLKREAFCLVASASKRLLILRNYLSSLALRGATQKHIAEVDKRLQTKQKNLTFEVAGMSWCANKDFVLAYRKPEKSK